MKLVLYSGGQQHSNHRLHAEVVRLCTDGKRQSRRPSRRLRMTYMPFCLDGAAPFYARFRRRYQAHGVTDFEMLAADAPVDPATFRRVLAGDAIYLAGGNTYYFLHHLRRAGLLEPLRNFARQGGVLAGLSAGALILTPDIGLAGVPSFDADENEVRLRDLRALGLTRFEFSPHYARSAKRDQELMKYSLRSRHPVIASADGGGVVVNGDSLEIHGTARIFERGRHLFTI